MCYRMMLIIVPNPILILKNVAIVISIILIHLKRIDVGTFGAINTWRKYSSTDLWFQFSPALEKKPYIHDLYSSLTAYLFFMKRCSGKNGFKDFHRCGCWFEAFETSWKRYQREATGISLPWWINTLKRSDRCMKCMWNRAESMPTFLFLEEDITTTRFNYCWIFSA